MAPPTLQSDNPFAQRHKRGRNKKGTGLDIATGHRSTRRTLRDKGEFPGTWSGCFAKWSKQTARQNWTRRWSHLRWQKRHASYGAGCLQARSFPTWGLGARRASYLTMCWRLQKWCFHNNSSSGKKVTVPTVANLLGTCIDVWNEEVPNLHAVRGLAQADMDSVEDAAKVCKLSLSSLSTFPNGLWLIFCYM